MNISYPGVLQDADSTNRFLQRLVDELNLALEETESGIREVRTVTDGVRSDSASQTVERAEAQYNDLKALIIKTSDIVKDEMQKNVTTQLGSYVAKGEWGEYNMTVEKKIEDGVDKTNTAYQMIEDIDSKYGRITSGLEGNIVQGIITVDGEPQTGIAVGQNLRVDSDGNVDTNNHMAFFTSQKLSFWLNGEEVAYFSDAYLHVEGVTALKSVRIGRWLLDDSATYGLVLKWVGDA